MNTPTLDLALVGNCAVGALVNAQARIVWCCMPRFDGEPVFHALVDTRPDWAGEGSFAIELEGLVKSEQAYEPGTAVLRTRLYDAQGGVVEVTDFAPRFFSRDRTFRPAQLARRVVPLAGHPRVRVVLRPVCQWGAARPVVTRGSNHLRFVDAGGAGATLRLTTDAPLTYVQDETPFSLHAPMHFLLGPDETLDGAVGATVRHFEDETVRYWRVWTRRLALPLEWQDAVIRSAITLKLCQYEETGAIVAAMTTSIPEAANSGRNWDYRYCWLRDAFFVVRALNGLSEVGTMENYLRWVYDVVRGAAAGARRGDGHVQPLYGIGREEVLTERTLPHLAGYRGMGPVRVGNQAFEHFQHDVYGNIVLAAAQAFHDQRLFRRAGADDYAALERVGERAWVLHDQPDAGMWELRTRERVHTSSSLMCWAACDRLAKAAQALGLPARAAHWGERARTIRAAILDRAWSDKRQAFAESFGGHDLDASVLLMGEVGLIDAHDPRFVSTLKALEDSLCDGPYMRRYEAADDFGKPETAFNVCAFWRLDALARVGRTDEAREIFEALLARRNHVGLLSEDTDIQTGELWGNFPQTYSMVGIVNGAVRLSRPWDDVV